MNENQPIVAPVAEEVRPVEAGNIIALAAPGSTAAPAQVAEDENDSPYVKVDGHSYKLNKRTEGRDAAYSLHFMWDKKWHKHSLQTNNLKVAKKRAKEYVSKVRAGKWDDVERMKARSDVANYGEVWDAFVPAVGSHMTEGSTSRKSATDYLWALGKALRIGLGIVAPGDNGVRKEVPRNSLMVVNKRLREVSMNEVNEALVREVQAKMVARYVASVPVGKEHDGLRTLARERALRSSRSIIHQARGVFRSKVVGDLIPEYAKRGVIIPPSVSGFIEAKMLGSDSVPNYFAPPDELVHKAFERIEDLKETRPDVYRAFWLAVGVGLRKSEIWNARWENFIERNGGEVWFSGVKATAVGKNKKVIEVRVQSLAWEKLAPLRQKTGRVIGDNATPAFARHINEWMTNLGWNTRGKVQELRAYVGSLAYKKNPAEAQAFMRHAKRETTEKRYVRYGGKTTVSDVL